MQIDSLVRLVDNPLPTALIIYETALMKREFLPSFPCRLRDHLKGKFILTLELLGWQLSNCGFFLENQRQFFHGTK